MLQSVHRLRRFLSSSWPLLLLLLLVALFVLKARVVENHYGQALACDGCFFVPSLVQDLWVLALAGSLLLVMVLAPWRLLSAVAGLALGALFLAYIADVYILHAFGIRLFLADVAIYGLNAYLIFEQFSSWAGGLVPGVVAVVVLVLLAIIPALLPKPARPRMAWILAVVVALASLTAVLSDEPDYVNSWIYLNFLQANARTSESVRYSEAEAVRHTTSYTQDFPKRCLAAGVDRRNVTILLVESLSNYQSELFGGHLDWTPALDSVAKESVRYTQFHAGGFSTTEALINTLGGVRLWAPFQHLFNSAEFSNAWGIEDSLVQSFAQAGHHTAFLTTSPLDFLRWGEWLADVGFEYIEGNQHPFYRDWPKISFHSAGDEALYRRTLQWMDEQDDQGKQPYLLVLETVSTHQPYINPDTGAYDMEGSFRYADRWAGWFHDQLDSRGYFDSGVLLILGDHRSMTPISQDEHERFGPAAPSLIPLVLVDREWSGPSVVERTHSQADLLPGFQQRLFGEVCLDGAQTALFEGSEAPPGCAFHVRGTPRGTVDVFCDEGRGQVRLDGDDTRFIENSGLSEQRQEKLLQVIAVERLHGLERVP